MRSMDAGVDAQIIRFREFELDLGAHQLRLRGQPVRLERRPFELLVLLVSRRGILVPREEIIERLWPANVVIDFNTGLNTLVRKVRRALGDTTGNPVFIETVAGLGYRFIAPIDSDATPNSAADPPVLAQTTSKRRWHTITALIVLLLVSGSAFLFWQTNLVEPERIRIAVFPFENLTGDGDLSYLAAGVAEETSTSLAQIKLPNLSVIGGVSARALASSDLSLQRIGSELGVDFIVMSSLRLESSRVRVTSRLIRTDDGEQIWSASFDRELTNVLGLQRELSIAIAEQIRQRLSPEVAAAIDRRQTQNPEAYDLYLKGRYEWSLFRPDSITRALEYYQQAVIEDPGYALAWAGIAHTLVTSPVTAEARIDEVVSSSQDALQRAMDLGPDLAETQLARGSYHFFLDQDLLAAEEAARRAVTLDPNSAMSHMFLGIVLSQRARHIEARAMLRRARELDPLFPLMFANSAVVALAAQEPEEALEFATQAIAINPEFWVGYLHLGTAWLALGNFEAALRAFSNAEKFSGGNSARIASSRAFVLAKLGRQDEARDIRAQLVSRSSDRYVPAYSLAVIDAGLDEIDSAFEWLERDLANHGLACLSLANDRKLETLRADLRFESLMNRCKSVARLGSLE